jgi:undecaprenyl-diphosphatase
MRRLNCWMPPRWFRVWMVAASRAGDGWLWYALGLGILLFGGEERFVAVAAAALSAAVAVGLFMRLKRVIGRKRPFEPHCWAKLLPPDQFSFPSGHSMTACAVTVPLSEFYPQLALALLFCALSVAASRIVLGMHFLSDVVVGSGLGAVLGYVIYSLVQ